MLKFVCSAYFERLLFTPSYLIHWFMSPKNREFFRQRVNSLLIPTSRNMVNYLYVYKYIYTYIYIYIWHTGQFKAFMPWAVTKHSHGRLPFSAGNFCDNHQNPAEILVETVVQGQPSSVGKHRRSYSYVVLLYNLASPSFCPEFHPQTLMILASLKSDDCMLAC